MKMKLIFIRFEKLFLLNTNLKILIRLIIYIVNYSN